jgi:hypothetical protein
LPMGVRQASTTNTELTATYLSGKPSVPTIGHGQMAGRNPRLRRRYATVTTIWGEASNLPGATNVVIGIDKRAVMRCFPI